MLGELLSYLHNWFVVSDGVYEGSYTVKKGSISLPFLTPGQYFRIVGSVFNDGVYRHPAADLTDEVFNGAVWVLAVPPEVLALVAEIGAWTAANPMGPYTSESFGGYSYTRAAGAGGQPVGWQEVFRSRLNLWRKV